MIRTKFSERKRYITPCGSRFLNVYQEQISKKTGKTELVKTGETDVYEMIQQDLEQSKIEYIIHKLAIGDYSVLKQADITYVDATEMPKTLMEIQNIVVKAKQEFNKFPAEVRKEFNNSPEQYVSEMGTEEFFKKLTPYNDEIKNREKEEADAAYLQKVRETAAFNKAVNAEMGVESE